MEGAAQGAVDEGRLSLLPPLLPTRGTGALPLQEVVDLRVYYRLLDAVQRLFGFGEGQFPLFRLSVLALKGEAVLAALDLPFVILANHLNPYLHGYGLSSRVELPTWRNR